MRLRIPVLAAVVLLGTLGVTAPAYAAPGQCVTTLKGKIGTPWSQRRLRPTRAWPLTTGTGVTVAVIDGGVDAAQPQLRGQVTAGPNLLGDGSSTSDCSGHGTMVAGIIAAKPVAGSPFHGIAPGARILSIRQNEIDPVLGAQRGDTAGMATAIVDAVDRGAQVINISATTPTDTATLRSAVRYALRHNVVIVAAAGNDQSSTDSSKVYYPAAYPGVLAVAATDSHDRRIDSSHSGAYVGIGAPGEDIVSTGPNGPGRYAMETGTSFAAPFVSGVAALVRSYRPELSAAQVVARIEATADPPRTADAGIGAGIVNPYAAVTAVLPASARSSPVRARQPLPAHRAAAAPAGRAMAFTAAALAVLAVAAAFGLAAVLPGGRLRRWRAPSTG